MSDQAEPISSVADLIRALSGPAGAAAVLDETIGNVRAWKFRGWIPPDRFVKHSTILGARKIHAAPALWRQAAPGQAA